VFGVPGDEDRTPKLRASEGSRQGFKLLEPGVHPAPLIEVLRDQDRDLS
jgi:hypothetical protein